MGRKHMSWLTIYGFEKFMYDTILMLVTKFEVNEISFFQMDEVISIQVHVVLSSSDKLVCLTLQAHTMHRYHRKVHLFFLR